MRSFKELTKRIGRALGSGIDDDDHSLLRLRIARRKIVENAATKLPLLRDVLERRGPSSLEQALIYASAKEPQQFANIASLLTDLGVRWAGVTQETTTNRSALERTLATFQRGGYQVLLAKKVLDEGIDIPSIREAFIVASSTVEREWIQRRGRVLRRHSGKPFAVVHDFLSLPPPGIFESEDSANVKSDRRKRTRAGLCICTLLRNAAGKEGVLAGLANPFGLLARNRGSRVGPSEGRRSHRRLWHTGGIARVNNYDRIFAEIVERAAREAPQGLAPSVLVDLILEVVDLEDRKAARIRQKVENKVRAVAVTAFGQRANSQGPSSGAESEPTGAVPEES